MSYGLTVSCLVSGARARGEVKPAEITRLRGALRFLDAFVCLKHVLDIALEYQRFGAERRLTLMAPRSYHSVVLQSPRHRAAPITISV